MPRRNLIGAVLLVGAVLLPAAPAVALVSTPDPRFADQWALQADGPLDAPRAWTYGDGTGSVVAIVDSGIDLTHPDLRGALWVNPGEVPGNGKDDDRDGFVDDVNGADIADNDGDPSDRDGHGTHVAGIVAAQRNAIGTVGVAPGVKVMAVRVLDDKNVGTTDDLAKGISYAVAHGATIINTSLNGDGDDDGLNAAIAQAAAAGVTIVASSGNAGRDLDLKPSYPASSDSPNVVAVAATDKFGLLAGFSDFGRRSVDIAAPGVQIVATARGGGIEWRSGTSMSAPIVAATLALMHGARPDVPQAQLRAALLDTATRPKGLLGRLLTGEVDPVAALKQIGAQAAVEPTTMTARVTRRKGARSYVTWKVAGDTSAVASIRINGRAGKTLKVTPATTRGAWVAQRTGRIRVTARAADKAPISAITVAIR